MRRQAAQDYERWLERNPDARPWIRTATWQVPINWFVLVSDEEREYDGAAGPGDRRPCCATGRRWCRPGAGWPGACAR